MKVGIIQSNYIPWRGYFDFIDDVDVFIFHDDIQFTKNDWRNRNRIKTDRGTIWLTVPVHYKSVSQTICNTPIDYSQRWNYSHIHQVTQWYAKAPFFKYYSEEFFSLLRVPYQSVSALNIALCRWIMEKLNIQTSLRMSLNLDVKGSKTERVVHLLQKVGGDCYLSGPAARAYLDEKMLWNAGIRLEYKSYDYPSYLQLWGDFIGEVTVMDLLFNMGPDARTYIKSLTPNQVVSGQ